MPLKVGDRLTRYEIRSFLGAGGMGEVYRAHDTRLDREVAVKVLPEGLTEDPDRLLRFEREARAAAALHHANILAVHDVGEHEGRSFLVTELLEGESLRNVIASGTLTLGRAIELGRQIATGLAAAHDAGITHRDIKPANLFLTDGGQAKILDFGLAKLVRPRDSETEVCESPTRGFEPETRAAMGTPGYMSPEQLTGQAADHRSDVFSFGVVLFEMIAGRHPFQGRTPTDLQIAILRDDPLPLSRIKPEVPPLLEHLVNRCLQKRPQDRFQSAKELLFALEELSTGQYVTAAPKVRSRLLRRAAVVTAVAAMVVVLALVFQRPSQGVPFQERDWLLITDVENHTGDPAFEKALDPAMTVAIEQSSYANVLSRASVQRLLQQMRRSDVAVIDEELAREIARRRGIEVILVPSISRLGNRYVLTASLKSAENGATYASRMVRADGIDDVLPALDILCREIRSDLGETLLSITEHSKPMAEATTSSIEALQQFSLATEHHLRSQPLLAMEHYQAALQIDPMFTSAKVALAILNLDWAHSLPKPDPELARNLLDEAVDEVDSLTESERLQALAHHAQFVEHDLERAAELFRTQLSIYPDRPQIHHNLAIIYKRLGRPNEARAEYERAIEIDPNLVVAYNGLLWLLREEFGDADAMIEWAERELEIADDQIWAHLNLTFAYIGRGDGELAVAAARQGVESAPESMWTHYHLGHALECAGRWAEAAATYDRVYEMDPEQSWALYHAGHSYDLAGDAANARDRFAAFAAIVEGLIADGDDFKAYPLWLDFARIRLGESPRYAFEADELVDAEPIFIWYLAQRYALLDQTEEAIGLLEAALDRGLDNPIWAFAICTFDPIRDHPGFQELQRATLGLDGP